MEEDNLSSASFVSSISASSIHQPRPPDGPKPSSQGLRAKRTGKIIRSPYLATSTPYPNKKQQHRPVNGTAFNLQHELDDTHSQAAVNSNAKQRWAKAVRATGGYSVGWNSTYMPHPSASVFLQSLMKAPSFSAVVASKKRKRTQSASTGTRKNAPSSTVGADGKDAIALRDEVVELKKSLNTVTREKDLIQARYAKLEQALAKKDKEIEDLLASGHITSRDATRSLASSSTTNKHRRPLSSTAAPGSGSAVTASGSGAVIASLRGKVHSLERVLREKESALASLKREVSATRLREMEVQCEAYYREITRLTQLLADHAPPPTSGSPLSHREAQLKLKALNQATVKLASQLEQREAENQRLKQQLEKFHSETRTGGEAITHNEQGLRGSIADRYVDHKRSQLLSTIVDLELRLQEKEGTLESVCGEMQEKKAHYERRIGELSGRHNDANNRIKLLEGKLSEMESSQEKLRNIICKLKDDRTHYRTVAEDTQSELQEFQDKLEKEGMSKNDIVQELETLREKHQNEILARDHARKLSKHRSQLLLTPEKERQEEAAVTIQQRWKKRQAIQRQTKFQEATEQGILNIQSALRGHLTRKRMLSSHPPSHSPHTSEVDGGSLEVSTDISDSESSETCLAVERIQAALRGHVARQMALHDLRRLGDDTSAWSGVYLQDDSHPTSVTDMWQSPHPSSRSDQFSSIVPVRTGYHHPLNRAHQSSSRDVVKKKEQMKPWHQIQSTGRVQSPWHLPSSSDSSGGDTLSPREVAEMERGLLPVPSTHPETSSSSYSESNAYTVNREQALLADELT